MQQNNPPSVPTPAMLNQDEISNPPRDSKFWDMVGYCVIAAIILLVFFLPEKYLLRYALFIGALFGTCILGMLFDDKKPEETPAASQEPPSHALELSEHDWKVTAYHEAGHAICAYFQPEFAELERISIGIDERTDYAGRVLWKNSPDAYASDEQLKNTIVVKIGGTVAERIVFNKIFTGAHTDLYDITCLARDMAAIMGMGKRVGMCSALAGDLLRKQDLEDDIKDIIDECRSRAEKILIEHRDILDALAKELLDKKALNEEEIKAFFAKYKNC